jgi:hypothetical protein
MLSLSFAWLFSNGVKVDKISPIIVIEIESVSPKQVSPPNRVILYFF